MARKAVPRQPTPYELLALRVKKQILTPKAQAERRAVISRLPDEPEEAWSQLLDELSEEESVQMDRCDDGAVQLSWAPHASD